MHGAEILVLTEFFGMVGGPNARAGGASPAAGVARTEQLARERR